MQTCNVTTLCDDLFAVPPLSHLRKENENLKAQASRFQQQMKKLDDDIKQNQRLLRQADAEQKMTKVSVCIDGRAEAGVLCSTDFLTYFADIIGLFQNKATKAQLELTDLKNVEEPQSEDLKPLVRTKRITAIQS